MDICYCFYFLFWGFNYFCAGNYRDLPVKDFYGVQAEALREIVKEANEQALERAQRVSIPKTLVKNIKRRLRMDPALSWDQALRDVVTGKPVGGTP